jgi:chemotaxis protein methyltransferase CheR
LESFGRKRRAQHAERQLIIVHRQQRSGSGMSVVHAEPWIPKARVELTSLGHHDLGARRASPGLRIIMAGYYESLSDGTRPANGPHASRKSDAPTVEARQLNSATSNTPPGTWPSLGRLSDADFARFQALIERDVGIFLSPAKKELVVARLARRLRDLELPSFSAYWDYMSSGQDPQERGTMINCICTNTTQFFREPAHFAFLEQRVLPELAALAAASKRPRSIRVWSAGCSTGEEPYSLAMALLRSLPQASGWTLSVLATDVSTRALDHATEATYDVERASEIAESLRRMFMLRGQPKPGGSPVLTFGPHVRRLIQFEQFNLMERSYAALGEFDPIFCRNVMIYFQPETRRAVVDRLLLQLRPDGYLFLGHAESLLGIPDRVRRVGSTITAQCRPVDDHETRSKPVVR